MVDLPVDFQRCETVLLVVFFEERLYTAINVYTQHHTFMQSNTITVKTLCLIISSSSSAASLAYGTVLHKS